MDCSTRRHLTGNRQASATTAARQTRFSRPPRRRRSNSRQTRCPELSALPPPCRSRGLILRRRAGVVSLRDDQNYGGHGYDRHVNISRQEMTDRVLDMARNYKGSKARDFVASRFFSEAEADALVRQVLDAHPAEVAAVRSGKLDRVELNLTFGAMTGELAFLQSNTTSVVVRSVSGVRVILVHSPLSPSGSYILTAYPTG